MECIMCEKNLAEEGQENVSPVFGKPLCENCILDMSEDDIDQLQEPYDLD